MAQAFPWRWWQSPLGMLDLRGVGNMKFYSKFVTQVQCDKQNQVSDILRIRLKMISKTVSALVESILFMMDPVPA